MAVLILYGEGLEKIAIAINIEVKGNSEEPWNPVRAEVDLQGDVQKVIAYRLEDGNPELVPLQVSEGRRLVVGQSRPKAPKNETEAEAPAYKVRPSHVALLTTWEKKTGIWTYTEYLAGTLGKLYPTRTVSSIHEVRPFASPPLLHVQHEFGVFPYVDELVGQRTQGIFKVATLHTVLREPGALLEHYYKLDNAYDAFIVHTQVAAEFAKPYITKPVFVIPHGSFLFDPVPAASARYRLALPEDAKVVFAFGFAGEAKGFLEVLDAARAMPRVTFVISAAAHGIISSSSEATLAALRANAPQNVRVLGEFLDEEQINLWASAADCLLYNYATPRFVGSASGALHRLLAAGKPVVCTAKDTRLVELTDGVDSVQYPRGDLAGMKAALEEVLYDPGLASRLGAAARKLAEETSWEKMAKKHMDAYGQVIGQFFGEEWYDEAYFVGGRGGKVYYDGSGEEKKWSYYNPTGEWLGARPVMEAVKKVFGPSTMLSVGEGRGTFLAYARDAGIDARGVDFSRWAVDHPYPRASGLLEWGDARDLSRFPDRSFDMLFYSDVLEHIYLDDLDKVVSEARRVSKKWLFFNNGSTMHEEEGTMVLKKGELPPKELQGTALAGHVTVQSCGWWRERLAAEGWKARDDLVDEFRKACDKVSPEILQNWHCLIAMERVG